MADAKQSIDPLAENAFWCQLQYDTWIATSELISRVSVNRLPEVVQAALTLFHHRWERSNEVPIRELRQLCFEWNELPESKRRELLNGWPVRSDNAGRPRMLQEAKAYGLDRFLTLAGDELGNFTGSVHREFNALSMPVRVMIIEGTSKADALSGLRRAVDHLQRSWDRLIAIDAKPSRLTATKKRPRTASRIPTTGKRNGKSAKAMAAA